MQRSHPSLSQPQLPPSSTRKHTQRLMAGLIVLVILLGIGFRVINVGQKAYWVDEVHTAVRIAGYTKTDITTERFNNQVYPVTDLNAYQIPAPDPSLADVLNTLAQHPEHPPLYYLLARWWMQAAMALGLPPSVAVTRSLSIIFSLLALPCVVGLCQELFRPQPISPKKPNAFFSFLTRRPDSPTSSSEDLKKHNLFFSLTSGSDSPPHSLEGPKKHNLFQAFSMGWSDSPSTLEAIIALSIFALSPLHILYGQEAREYSLWTLVNLLSCWAFLRAIRHPSLKRWSLYGLTLTIGWYSHLLFATVAIAHTLYFVLFAASRAKAPADAITTTPNSIQSNDDEVDDALRSVPSQGPASANTSANPASPASPVPLPPPPSATRPFLLTLAASLFLFLPWMGVFLHQFGQVQNVVDATQRDPSLGYLVNVWGRNLSRVWFSADLGSANILLVVGVIYALVYLWQTMPRRVSGFILLLIGVNALGLMVPDAITGGISSTRIRYLIPAYIGIQLAIAHLFSHQLLKRKGWSRYGWQIGVMGVLIGGAIAGCINTTQVTHWAKSDKSLYYPQMAEMINASDHPLVITDNSATYTLVLAHQLKHHVRVQLVDLQQLDRPKDLVIPRAVNGNAIRDLFLFAPSPPLRRSLEKQGIGPFEPVVRQSDRFQLLKAERSS